MFCVSGKNVNAITRNTLVMAMNNFSNDLAGMHLVGPINQSAGMAGNPLQE